MVHRRALSAVDERDNEIGVFGRIGARPLSLAEQLRIDLHSMHTHTVRQHFCPFSCTSFSGLIAFVADTFPDTGW